MNNKLTIGIDINEVLRAKWLQFDKYYIQEFGEEGIPEQPYVYDYFNNYPWNDKHEIIKELKEPENTPENINPLDYQVDKKTGEAPADFLLFKKVEKILLTAKEVYNQFMYEDFVFEIHGSAPQMYKGLDVHFSKFCLNYKNDVDLCIVSKENLLSIPSTLFFLSVLHPKIKKYFFVETNKEIWNNVDILITADPELLINIPLNKKVIKIIRPFNEKIKSELEIMNIYDLSPIEEESRYDNNYNKCEEFKKIIKNFK